MKLYIFCILLCTLSAFSQDKIKKEANFLYKEILANHVNPRNIDDSLALDTFDKLILELDEFNTFFTDNDIEILSKEALEIETDFSTSNWIFFEKICQIYNKRIAESIKILDEIGVQKLSYTVKDSFMIIGNNYSDFVTETEIKSNWIKFIKYKVLWRMIYENSEKISSKDFDFINKEKGYRQKIIKKTQKKLQKLLAPDFNFKAYIAEKYFNAFAECFDPHTNYFSKETYLQFTNYLSTSEFSFGFSIEENEHGDIEITSIAPGGPAWKSNELHKKDLIINIKHLNKVYDILDFDEDELNVFLNNSKINEIEIVVQKTDGSLKSILLNKEKNKNENNIIKSYVINDSLKIGYINLPSFYFDTDDNSGLGCANDVAKEIIKLKAEGIKGLIFDLRYNGGGSVNEGLSLLGLFINEGPLLSTTNNKKINKLEKDPNRGTIYDGPLVVLVNGQSASASELFASTIKEYNRGIIVGSKTFGKATGQITIPLGVDLANLNSDFDITNLPYGWLKVTSFKIYKLNGESNQKLGVIPDVELPNLYEKMNYTEEAYDFVINNDLTTKKPFFSILKPINSTQLNAFSQKRQGINETFVKLKKVINETPNLLSRESEEKVELTLKDMIPIVANYKSWVNKITILEKENSKKYKITATKDANILSKLDETINNLQLNTIEYLERDAFLQESYRIMIDLINFNK